MGLIATLARKHHAQRIDYVLGRMLVQRSNPKVRDELLNGESLYTLKDEKSSSRPDDRATI